MVSIQQYQKPNFKDQLTQTIRARQQNAVLQLSRIITNIISHIARRTAEVPEKSWAGTVIILVQENGAGLFVWL